MAKIFPVIIKQDEDGKFIATCPVFEGCYSQGDTFEDAMNNIREAIELCQEENAAEEIPLQSIIVGNVAVNK